MKNEYLQAFKNGIAIFEESYQQKKVLELEDEISSQISKGKSEEEVIQGLGTVERRIEKVLKENHVNIHNQRSNSFFSSKCASLLEIINHIIDVMSKNNSRTNAKIIFDILILIFLVCILKIPFILVRDLGDSLLSFLEIPIVLNFWHLVIELVYVILAVVVFLNIFKRWFRNLKVGK